MAFHRRRRGVPPLTPLRAYRLQRGLTLAEVAARADMTTFRASIIERNPKAAHPDEIRAHRAACDSIHAERKQIGGAA